MAKMDTGLLITYRNNAAATDLGAIGHTKAAMNNALFVAYSKELKKRGVMNSGHKYQDLLDAAKLGAFNGPGTA